MSPEVHDCLQNFLDVCRELMKDNNKTNPWEICAAAYVLPIIFGVNDKIEKEVLELLDMVNVCDPQRKEMYNSWADKIILTNFLHQKLPGKNGTVLEALLEKEGNVCFQFNE